MGPGGPSGPGAYPSEDPRGQLSPEQAQIVQIAVQDPMILSAIAATLTSGANLSPDPAALASMGQSMQPSGPPVDAAAMERQLLGA